MTRDRALELIKEYTTKPALIGHMLAVEAVMRFVAGRYQADVEAWGLAGLLHDFDYENFHVLPDHPVKGSEILKREGVDEEVRQAILGHANLPDYPRTSLMAKALFAVDELTGLVMAVTYVRPSRSIEDVSVKSVQKKLKDKAFAAGVSREDIYQGATELGVEVEQLIEWVIEGLKMQAEELGLDGKGE